MADLGPGPRRWRRAEAAYAKAVVERDRDICKAVRARLGTGQQIADAYGLTKSYVYRLVAQTYPTTSREDTC